MGWIKSAMQLANDCSAVVVAATIVFAFSLDVELVAALQPCRAWSWQWFIQVVLSPGAVAVWLAEERAVFGHAV